MIILILWRFANYIPISIVFPPVRTGLSIEGIWLHAELRKDTFAFWIKRNAVDSYDAVIGNSAKTNRDFILFNDANTYLHLERDTNGDS